MSTITFDDMQSAYLPSQSIPSPETLSTQETDEVGGGIAPLVIYGAIMLGGFALGMLGAYMVRH